jgi:hypothetical protein
MSSAAIAAGTSAVRLLPDENFADMMITCACRRIPSRAGAREPRTGPCSVTLGTDTDGRITVDPAIFRGIPP